MFINSNNLAGTVKFALETKYLSPTGAILTDSTGKRTVTKDGLVLFQIEISQLNIAAKVVNSKLRLKVKSVEEDARYDLYLINESSYKKKNSTDIDLSSFTIIDSIFYNGKPNLYDRVDELLEFDLTKYLYDTKRRTRFIWFALKSSAKDFNIYDIDELFKKEIVLTVDENNIRGLDDIYEYTQEDVGFAGISSINLASGKLIHKVEPIKTSNSKNPAAFHAFFNIENPTYNQVLGKYWRFSGDYTITRDDEDGVIELIDPSNKSLVLYPCRPDDIKDLYNLDPISPFNGEYFVCFGETVYCLASYNDLKTFIFVDRYNNKMYFETDRQLLTKIELGTGKTITYEYDSNGRPKKITDGDGEYLAITYSIGKVYVKQFSFKDVLLYKVEFDVTNETVNSIKSYIGDSSIVVNEALFTYDDKKRLVRIVDKTNGIGSRISYSNQNQVTKVVHEFIGDIDEQKYTTYDYYTFQTRVTDYTGFYSDYYFDYLGRCRSVIDCEAKSIVKNYKDISNGISGGLISESKVQVNERNIIDNNSFDSGDLFTSELPWKLVYGSKNYFKVVDGGVYGQKCLKVEKGVGSLEIKQDLYLPLPGTYTFKTFFKAICNPRSILASGDIKAIVKVKYLEEIDSSNPATNKSKYGSSAIEPGIYQKEKEYVVSNTLGGTFDWNAYEKTGVVIPGGENISNVTVTVHLVFGGSRYVAYVDDLSLTFGDHNVRYNYINNGYFEGKNLSWICSNIGANDFIEYTGLDHPLVLGSTVLRMKSDLNKCKVIYKKIAISGNAGESLLLTLFGKGNVSKNDTFQAYLKIHYLDKSEIVMHTFDFDPNYENWQVLTRNVIAERSFDYVEVGVKARAKSDVYVDAIQLYKDDFGKEYSYTEQNNLSEVVNSDGSFSNISYDSNSRVTEMTDVSGDTFRFTYGNATNRKVAQITNNQNSKIMYKYSGENKTETKIITSTGETLCTKDEYDEENKLISQTDDTGAKTLFNYDEIDRLNKQVNANGLVTTFKYDVYGKLKEKIAELGGARNGCIYTYDSKGNISSITACNGTKYTFSYTIDQQLSTVALNGKTIVKNFYTKIINGINTNLLTKQILGDSEACGFYNFEYDKKERLTKVRFNNVVQVEYKYNENNQPSEIYDCINDNHLFLSYNSNGDVVSALDSSGNQFAYDYDNLKNVQKEITSIDGLLRSFDYEYKYEYNDYTPSGYFARLERAFPDEIIKGGSGFEGVYGGRSRLNTIRRKRMTVLNENPLDDSVASLVFKDDNAVIAYDTSTFNRERKGKSTSNKNFDLKNWQDDFNHRKTIYAWIKPIETIKGAQRVFALAEKEASKIRFTLSALADGKIEIKDNLTNNVVTSRTTLKMDSWNLVCMKLSYSVRTNKRTIKLILNDEITSIDYFDKSYITNLKYFILGAPSDDLSMPDLYSLDKNGYLTDGKKYPLNMKFKVSFVSVGSSDITDENFKGIYFEGLDYLCNKPNYGASGVTYFNDEAYEGYDVISLNGSLTSLKKMKPKVYAFSETSFRNEKQKMFKFDRTGVNPLYRHVYASYDGVHNLNNGSKSKLAYDLLIKDQGNINLRFKVDDVEETDDKVVLYSVKDGKQVLKIFVYGEDIYLRTDSNEIEDTCMIGYVNPGEWINLSLIFDANGHAYVKTDYDEFPVDNIYINLEGALTYFGCAVDSNNNPCYHLNGCMEMISFKDSYATLDEINRIIDDGQSISVRTYFDEMGRTEVKKIHYKNKELAKKYAYKKYLTNTTTKVESEQLFNGESLNYEYDSLGNITSIKRLDSSNSEIDKKEYTYDGLSRLTKSNINGLVHTYSYDSNNNIKTKDGLTYTYDSVDKDKLISRSDGVSITYCSSITSNPSIIKKPNKILNFAWSGKRVAAINNALYAYDYNGTRIERKIINGYTYKYILEGERLVALKRIKDNKEKRVSFVYDEVGSLVGLSIGTKEYIYERNIQGEILRVINLEGKTLVEYSYDDWGKPSIKVVDKTEGQLIADINPFVYKGYIYDQDTGLYYLKSRYYDPELGRFINSDNEVGSVGNISAMNMYAYCKCNPISYADENGNMPSWAIKVCIGIGVIALSGIVAVATMGTSLACNGLTMLYGAVTGALIGAASGAVFGALLGAAMEGLRTGTLEGALRGAKKGAVNGAADGFMWGAIGGAVSGAINGRFCFVAGTLVMTKEGYKAIEKIEEGEEVLSYNENLGIFEYKEVVEVYKNETKELSHIKTKKDEIVSTPGHSILTSEGWKKAKDIKVNDLIKTKEGYERVIEVDSEELEEVENVYNLNVLGYHTYVVGYGLLVVHNQNCSNPNGRKGCKEHQEKINEIEKQLKTEYPGYDIRTEIYVKTPGGYKKSRYIDVGVVDDEKNVIIGYQVGVGTKSGRPVAREVRALEDIANSIGEGKVIFVTYK